MLETAKDGVFYGVEVQFNSHADAAWHTRYGWFEEIDRAKDNYNYALTDVDVVNARIVKKTVTVEIVE